MSKVLATYRSTSNPSVEYLIVRGDDGVTYCTCWQWKKHRNCKHLEQFKKDYPTYSTLTSDPLQAVIDDEVRKLTS